MADDLSIQNRRSTVMKVLQRQAALSRGTSFLELVLTVSIASVLSAGALPSYQRWMSSRHLAPTVVELLAALNTARSEALTRGSRVVIAARNDDWASGWQVFVDANDNGILDEGETLLRNSALSAPGLTVTPNFGAVDAGRAISYNSSGQPARPGSKGLVLGRMTLAQGASMRRLCFASLRVRVVSAATCG
jgi:type IV fimbrial biogenesis protein FimT